MADTIDISSWQDASAAPAQQPAAPSAQPAQGSPQPAGTMTAQPAAQPAGIDISDMPDPSPLANGMSPLTPINKSPLGVEERFKLSLGNEKGKLDYLKQRFEAVTKNENGDYVVKDKGVWHMVDGSAFGDVDPWTATKGVLKTAGALGLLTVGADKKAVALAESNPTSKELMSEYAENLPTATAIGASALAGMATGGASLAAQAVGAGAVAGAHELARTSLGRLEGTYQATPEEQVKDAAFESMLNLAGVYVAAGVKPGAAYMADKLAPLAAKIKAVGSVPANLLKNTYAALTVGGDNFETMLEHTPDVRAAMKSAASITSDNAAYVDHLTGKSIQAVKNAANSAQPLLTDVYKGLSKQLAEHVDDGFHADLGEITGNIFKKAVDDGFVVLRDDSGKLLQSAESAAAIANANGRIPNGFKVVTRSLDDIKNVIKATGDMTGAEVAFDSEAHGAMKQFFETAADLHGIPSLKGKAGFEQLMKFNKILNDSTFKLKTMAEDQGLAFVQRQMAAYNDIVDQAVGSKLEERGLGQMFSQMQNTYSSMKDQMAPLLTARFQAARGAGDAPFERLLTKIAAKPGKNVVAKDGINSAIAAAKQYSSPFATVFESAQKAVRVNNAAIAFNPLVKPGFVGQGSMTMALGAAASGNLGVAGTLAAGAAVTSPRLAQYNIMLAKSLGQGRDFLLKQGAQGADTLLKNPPALNAFVTATMQTPLVAEQTKNALLGSAGIPPK